MFSYLHVRSGDRSGLWRAQDGFTLIAVLLALLIAAALYFGYFKMQSTMSARSTGVSAIDAAGAVACRSNRQNVERDVAMWSVNHPDEMPSFHALEAEGIHIPTCPQGGRYELLGRGVRCSVHGG